MSDKTKRLCRATHTSYAVKVGIENMKDILSKDYSAAHTTDDPALWETLEELDGVDNVEYDGHFGDYVHYRVDADEDCEGVHERIVKEIENYLGKEI